MKKVLIVIFFLISCYLFADYENKQLLLGYEDYIRNQNEKYIEKDNFLLKENKKRNGRNLSFYPMGIFVSTFIVGAEFPFKEKNSIEIKAAEFLLIFEKYTLTYRRYRKDNLEKLYFGTYCGYRKAPSEKDRLFYGIEIGYKSKISEKIYMSNAFFIAYSEFEENNIVSFIEIFKIHIDI